MMVVVLLLQVVLPIGLILWLASAPAKNVVGYLAQAIGTGLLLFASYVIALWMLLPWWLPLAYGLLWLMTIVVNICRRGSPFVATKPATVSGWTGFIAMFAIGTLATYLSWQGIQGRQPPNIRVVDIPLPLGPGIYLVASGGSRELVNGHMMTLDPKVERFRAYLNEKNKIDLRIFFTMVSHTPQGT